MSFTFKLLSTREISHVGVPEASLMSTVLPTAAGLSRFPRLGDDSFESSLATLVAGMVSDAVSAPVLVVLGLDTSVVVPPHALLRSAIDNVTKTNECSDLRANTSSDSNGICFPGLGTA
jgi:hypothetical protein